MFNYAHYQDLTLSFLFQEFSFKINLVFPLYPRILLGVKGLLSHSNLGEIPPYSAHPHYNGSLASHAKDRVHWVNRLLCSIMHAARQKLPLSP